MTEPTTNTDGTLTTDAKDSTNTTSTLTPAEVAALEKGWKPKDQWEGEEDDFISAQEFLRRGELFDRINKDKHKLTSLERQVQEMANQFVKMQKTQYEKAVADLKAQRKEAMRDGNYDEVDRIEAVLDEVKASAAQTASENTVTTKDTGKVDPAFLLWMEEHTWYGRDEDKTEDADAFAQAFVAKNPNAPLSDILEHVTKKIDKLHGNKGKKMSAVSSSNLSRGSVAAGKPKPGRANMTDTQVAIMKTMVAAGAFKTEDEYIEELAKIGAI